MLRLVRKNAISEVLSFLYGYWERDSRTVLAIAFSMTIATVADLMLPIFSGRLVDAITPRVASQEEAFHNALLALSGMAGLGIVLVATRYVAFIGICGLTVRLMSRMASDAFWRVQRLSTDWHANNFTGSLVRRVTRGMWALDLMNDTLLLALLPALIVLVGSALVLGAHWTSM